MRTYKIKVTFFNGSSYKFQRNDKKIRKMVNVNNLVFNMFKIEDIKRIEVFCFNDNTKKYYKQLTYDHQIETWKNNHNRIERIEEGYKQRFYIGKSTGWIPIYLEIKRDDSSGGFSLWNKNLTVVY